MHICLQGYLVSVTGNDTINLWSLRQRPAGVMYQLHLKKEKCVCFMMSNVVVMWFVLSG